MLCTTNIWIKIQKCVIPHKNLYFLPTFASKNSSQNTKNGPFGNVIRKDPGAARRRMRRAGDAAFHRETADPLALRETRRRPDADERHRRDAPRKTGRTFPPRTHPSRTGHRIGRRHEKIPLPHTAGRMDRIGLHSRRRPGHAVRLVAGRMPHGMQVLRNGTAGAAALADGGRNPQPDRLAARTRQPDERRLYGHGRAARQYGQRAEGARNHDFGVGLRPSPRRASCPNCANFSTRRKYIWP